METEDRASPLRASILVVDDEPEIRQMLVQSLERMHHHCWSAPDGEAALLALQNDRFDLVITDLQMPRMDGMSLLRAIAALPQDVSTIVLTAHGNIQQAVEAMQLGASDFLSKPVLPELLNAVVQRVLEHRQLVTLNRRLTRQTAAPATFNGLVGGSPVMLEVFRTIAQVAPTAANVLVLGETGTGKERVARAIHALSARREKRFNVIDCTAIPEGLLESTLFGHRKGAFTGADRDHTGLVAYSDGGTIFFDEIGELPLLLQAKLLRLLQERTYRPLGAADDLPVDVRIIAATNRDLEAEAREGRFRQDLYYRLNVVPIALPPLCEREEDAASLALHFLSEFSDAFPQILGITNEALDCIRNYAWPGNVRELRNAIERGLSLATGDRITPVDLPERVRSAPPAARSADLGDSLETRDAFLARMEREYFTRLLIHFKGNVTQAAEVARISRKTLYRLLDSVGLRSEDFR